MKLICTQENLNQALSVLDRVVGKQSSLPILSNFLFETEKGRLKISATNLEIGIFVYVGAKIESEGKIAVPARIISQFIQNLPGGDVLELTADTRHLTIKGGTSEMKVKILDGKDFPIIPQYKKDYQIHLPAQDIKQALSRLLFCVSNNESRLELTGVCFTLEGKSVALAATDSFRLAEEIIQYKGEGLQEVENFIIPTQTLQEVGRSISQDVVELGIAIEENQLFIEIGNIQIVSRIISGKYPDYRQIIPKDFTTKVVLKREEFVRSLKIASTLSSYTSGEVALIFHPEEATCTVVAQSQEMGENQSVLKGDFLEKTNPLTVIFNPRHLIEGLSAFHQTDVILALNSSTSPVMLEGLETEATQTPKYTYIMMPIRKDYA